MLHFRREPARKADIRKTKNPERLGRVKTIQKENFDQKQKKVGSFYGFMKKVEHFTPVTLTNLIHKPHMPHYNNLRQLSTKFNATF